MARNSKSSKLKNNNKKSNTRLLRRIKLSRKSMKRILEINNLITLRPNNQILPKSPDKCSEDTKQLSKRNKHYRTLETNYKP